MLIRLLAGLLALAAAAAVMLRSRRDRAPASEEVDAGPTRASSRLERSVERRLRSAGLAGRFSVERLVHFKKLAGGIGLGVGALAFASNPSTISALFAILLTGVGFFGVDGILSHKASEHRKAVERSLPDVLDQLTICVGAGLGLDGALQRVVRSNEHDPLADEL